MLVERYHRNLLTFIFRIVRDWHLAEDIGQEVFLDVYKELPSFDPGRGSPFPAWLFIVARNRSISELRRRGRSDRRRKPARSNSTCWRENSPPPPVFACGVSDFRPSNAGGSGGVGG